MTCLIKFDSERFPNVYRGKVRDSITLNDKERLIVVTDRISAFNKKIKTPIPHKGAVLNGIANFWFAQTQHIIDNHVIRAIDDNITLVKEANPIRIEMVVRGYLAGSMWRAYKEGKRVFSGIVLPDGLTQNQRFDEPILTPTTKDDDDTEITEHEIVTSIISSELYAQMKQATRSLFAFGSEYLATRGIVLVDTKYEFGLLGDKLILIDEIHTPDSSRFWKKSDYEANPTQAEQIDKEFVRLWLLANPANGDIAEYLPEDVVAETSRRYIEMYETIVNQPFVISSQPLAQRIEENLRAAGVLTLSDHIILNDEPKTRVKALILTGFGINCEEELAAAYRLAGADADILHLNEIFIEGKSIHAYDILNFPGGFSFGDDIASGKVLANKIKYKQLPNGKTLLDEIKIFINDGKHVMGICNGFQMLVRLGLLPNLAGDFEQEVTLHHNDSGHYEDRWVYCRVENADKTPFLRGINLIELPVRHGEGKLIIKDAATRATILANGQNVLTYCTEAGEPTAEYPLNPNGAELNCAGLCDTTGRVFGLMPHPEAFLSLYNHPNWGKLKRDGIADERGAGLQFFTNIVSYIAENKVVNVLE